MQRKRWTLPVLLGLITAVLLVAVLWPKETPKRTVVVAARDLGAGTALVASDLTTTILEASQAPADAVADPARLAGQTLAVVRFTGEPVTPRHLGPAVTLAPDERGIAISVKADTGLAGLLRPGMKVGVVATLAATAEAGREVYAKTTLEGLRVLYVSPDFQARPYTPATASATVTKSSSGGALGTDSTPATSSTGSSGTVREGVLVLAAGTQAQPIRYETTLPLTQTVSAGASVTETLKLAAAPAPKGKATTPAKARRGRQAGAGAAGALGGARGAAGRAQRAGRQLHPGPAARDAAGLRHRRPVAGRPAGAGDPRGAAPMTASRWNAPTHRTRGRPARRRDHDGPARPPADRRPAGPLPGVLRRLRGRRALRGPGRGHLRRGRQGQAGPGPRGGRRRGRRLRRPGRVRRHLCGLPRRVLCARARGPEPGGRRRGARGAQRADAGRGRAELRDPRR